MTLTIGLRNISDIIVTMNENDLRVQRTRQRLQDALIKLAYNQKYTDITIRDIVNEAQVGYKTFFRHYESKDMLLQAIIERYLVEFDEKMASSDNPDALRENTVSALELAVANRNLYLMVYRSPQASKLLQPILETIRRDGKRYLGVSDLPEMLVGHHYATTMMSLIVWWLEGEQQYTIDEMVQFIERLAIQPLQTDG